MSSMKLLYLCLIVIHSLVYGSEVPWVVSQIHIMSPSSGFCIWIWRTQKMTCSQTAPRRAESQGHWTRRLVHSSGGKHNPWLPVCQLQRGALTYRPFSPWSSEILHICHWPVSKVTMLYVVWSHFFFCLKTAEAQAQFYLFDYLELSLQPNLINLRAVITSFFIH